MAHLRGLEDRIDRPADAAAEAVTLFDDERFYEAYRHFAVAWQASGKRVGAYRALAQAAAGLCHVQRSNPTGARAVLERSAAGLERAVAADGTSTGPTQRATAAPAGIDLPALARALRTVVRQLERGEAPTVLPRLHGADDGPG